MTPKDQQHPADRPSTVTSTLDASSQSLPGDDTPGDDPGLDRRGVADAAETFKALANENRILILRALSTPRTVGQLVSLTGSSQPLVSQHLRILRSARLVTVTRTGREAVYAVIDEHIAHVVDDAVVHALEPQH